MTKQEIEDKYFQLFLTWCATAPEGSSSDLIFWLDHHFVNVDNFWEWVVRYRPDLDGDKQ